MKTKCREVKYYLNDYLEGKLIDEMREQIALHINKCSSCRTVYRELITEHKLSGTLRTKIHEGGEFWESSSEQNESDPYLNLPSILYSPLKRREDPGYRLRTGKRFLHSRWIAVAAPAGAVVLAVLIAILYFYKTTASFWQVETLKGSPVVGNEKIEDSGVIPLGEWLSTDMHSSARIKAGMIGYIDVDPASKLQLVNTKDKNYKIYLNSGKISVNTHGTASYFSVLTPSATYTDLGCSYTIEVGKNGSSFLHVDEGKVLISAGKEKEIIPEGAVCETMKNHQPGTPYFLSASTEFKAALSRFDSGNRSKQNIEQVIENSGKKDALSLWYLLRKAEPGEIKLIYDRLSEINAPPEGVTCEDIITGNTDMLFKWWDKLGFSKESLWQSISG